MLASPVFKRFIGEPGALTRRPCQTGAKSSRAVRSYRLLFGSCRSVPVSRGSNRIQALLRGGKPLMVARRNRGPKHFHPFNSAIGDSTRYPRGPR